MSKRTLEVGTASQTLHKRFERPSPDAIAVAWSAAMMTLASLRLNRREE
jgi:hypothetical protein